MEMKIGNLRDYIGKNDLDLIEIQIPDAEKYLRQGLQLAIGDNYQWLHEYSGFYTKTAQGEDKYCRGIVDWLTDNHGKGLLMYGHCGRGKSIIGEKVLPAIINFWYRHLTGTGKIVSCYSYRDLNTKLDEIKERHLIYLDDVGQEEVGKSYGNTIHAFADIVDNAEKKGHLLIMSTNLTLAELKEKYGDRVYSRLKGITQTVRFYGDDLRG